MLHAILDHSGIVVFLILGKNATFRFHFIRLKDENVIKLKDGRFNENVMIKKI